MKIVTQAALAAGVAITLCAFGPARADTFTPGDFVTYGQGDWSLNSTATNLLQTDFETTYVSTGGNLVVGVGSHIILDGASAVHVFLPQSGTPGALTASIDDPGGIESTASGVFGGDTTGLALNVNFSAAGLLGPKSTQFGGLLLTGLTGSVAGLNGMSINDVLALAEEELGGSSTLYAFADLDSIVAQINVSFEYGGVVTDFATDHLEFPNAGVGTTPLPAGLPLFASGLGALGLLARRRKRKAALAA
jgi:hypothetical protein